MFRDSGFRIRDSGFRFHILGLGIRDLRLGFQVSGPGIRDSGFRFRVLGFRLQLSDLQRPQRPCIYPTSESPSPDCIPPHPQVERTRKDEAREGVEDVGHRLRVAPSFSSSSYSEECFGNTKAYKLQIRACMKEEKNRGRAWMLRREKASRMLATACASHRDLG